MHGRFNNAWQIDNLKMMKARLKSEQHPGQPMQLVVTAGCNLTVHACQI